MANRQTKNPVRDSLIRLKGAAGVGLNRGLARAAGTLAAEAKVAADSLQEGLDVKPEVTGNVLTPERIEYVVSTDERLVEKAVADSLDPLTVLGYAATGIQGRMQQQVTQEVRTTLQGAK
jgi:hypothetical protein